MHDNQLSNLCGWPDLVSTASVVRCIKQSLPVSMPTGFSGTTWDCHVVAWPWLANLDFNTFTRANNVKAVAGTIAGGHGGVCAFAVQPGAPLSLASSAQLGKLTLDQEYSKGSGRILGMGVEIINTTSDLNRQGTATVWRQEEATMPIGALNTYTAANIVYNQTVQYFRPPPFSVANAMLYPGSRQWKAADGAYQVATFSKAENPPTFVGYVQPVIAVAVSDDVEGTPSTNTSALLVPTLQTVNAVANCAQAVRILPLNMFGSMFTGLSTQTTLTINVNVYYESFPSVAEPGILVLAKPSATFDPIALGLMSLVNSTLPVGVPASWNPGGEWFWEIVNDVVDMAPMLGGVFGPEGAMIGRGIKAGYDKLTDRYTPDANAKREEVRKERRAKAQKKSLPRLMTAPGDTKPTLKPRKRNPKKKAPAVSKKR